MLFIAPPKVLLYIMSVQVQETVPLFNLEANHAYGTPATPIVWNCFSSIEPQGNKPSTTYSLPHKSRLLRTQLVALPFTREKSGHLWRTCITKWSLRYKSTHLGIVNMKAKLCMDKTNQEMDSNWLWRVLRLRRPRQWASGRSSVKSFAYGGRDET